MWVQFLLSSFSFPVNSLLSLFPYPNHSLLHKCHFNLHYFFLSISFCLSSVYPSSPDLFVHCCPHLPSFRISSAPFNPPANATTFSATSLMILFSASTWNASLPSQLCTSSPSPTPPFCWQSVPI